MGIHRFFSRSLVAALVITSAFALLMRAEAAQRRGAEDVGIDNFGCINETFYRGAQPKKGDYQKLAEIGVKAVIDLQQDGERDEQRSVEAAGMKFYRIGLSDKSWPSPDKAQEFLKIVNDPANQPVFIHCHGGRHRAGIMTAVYRMNHDGWDAERAYAEMKRYGFESGIGHGSLKDYVFDYYAQIKSNKAIEVRTDKAGGATNK
jgi:protein tyrosine/serine phosphatase